MLDLKKNYKEKYDISYKALTDAGESNRLTVLLVTSIIILTEIIDFLLILILYHANLHDHIHYLIYLGIYTPYNIYIFLHARHSKNSNYLIKTIPVYLLFSVGLSAGIFNLYFMGSPHNGFVTYIISGFIFLIVFSFSPIFYLIELLVALIIMAPGVYSAFGIFSLLDLIIITIVMFCISLYKRKIEKKVILLLKKQKQNLVAKTFGNFTILYDNKVIKFQRSKSTELLAYLIYKNGSSVKTKELLSVLYGDHADSSKYGASLRNLIVDIRHSLAELEIQNFFITEYNNFRINPEAVHCDYYDFLAGEPEAIKSFVGEFMSQYSWAETEAAYLERRIAGK